jgi:hypothetical protein
MSGTRGQSRAGAVIAAIAAVFALFWWVRHRAEHKLLVADVPVRALALRRSIPEEDYPERFPMQVAVLRTSTDQNLLPVIHALSEMGIPFFVTRSLPQALRHRLVMLYPDAQSSAFDEAEIGQLRRHVETGGSIFAQEVSADALRPLFGFREVTVSKRRHLVRFEGGADAVLRYLDRPEELEVRLGSDRYPEVFWTQGYAPAAGATVLARFEDGTAALLRNRAGAGAAYLCGVALEQGVLRSQTNRHYEASRHYVNAFEPGADVWMLLLRAWYESQQPGAVRLATAPEGARSVLLFTHDVDWEDSFAPMLDYARAEEERGIRSLFFVQTKYVSDANSHAFFSGNNLAVLRELHSRGFGLGSHSIIHSRAFNVFGLGTGTETYASYRPRGTGANSAEGATVFGEVRVSRELLDGNVPGQHTVFFRARHLRVPKSLPEALLRCGYEFDSSFTAPDVLTNFPYALTLGLETEQDTGLYEFPDTIKDGELPPVLERVGRALDVIGANADNGAMSVVLIHTNEAGKKLDAEKAMLEHLPPGVRAMDPLAFARFWRARDRLRWSMEPDRKPGELVLRTISAEAVNGITFESARQIAGVSGDATLLPDHHRFVLGAVEPGKESRVAVTFQ